MKLRMEGSEIFVPDGVPEDEALARTTHLGVGAHPDDAEIMAYHGILACFGSEERWFCGTTVTNGSGSARDGIYADYTDEEMQVIRRQEAKKAGVLGEYSAVVLMNYPSSIVKDPSNSDPVEDIKDLVEATRPIYVYTHNFADKHDTHVGVALRTVQALRELPEEARPEALYGCEVWRDLDWMIDEDKVAFDVQGHENLAAALLGVFDSQDCGGKRYDLATLGRRTAHATYHATHDVDVTTALIFAMDLTPLMNDASLDVGEYVQAHIDRFAAEVAERIGKLSG
jgi:LmbE family N-acetylglucosaminyl deacetylase